jgi:hypothetical protein
MAHQSSRACAPPWQYSSSLGGEYIWDPQTDEIIMKTGHRLARPRHLPRDSFRNASYEGASSFQYVGSPPNGNAKYSLSTRNGQSSRSQASGSSPRTGKSKTTRELGDAMNRMSIAATGGPPGGAPGGAPNRQHALPSGRLQQPNRRIQALGSGGEVEVTIEPLVRDPVSRKAAVRPQDTGYRVRIDNWAVLRSFFPLFRTRTDAKSYFQVGCMFVVLRSGNAPASSIVTGLAPGTAINRRGQRVLAQARRFVVIQEGETYCYALPISTYGGRGVAQQGVTKSDHVIIFTTTNAPSSTASEAPQRGEAGMRPVPIRVESSSPTNALDPMSRLDLGCVTLVQHNHQVQPFGNVCDRSVSDLKQQFENVWGDPRIPEPQVSQDEESSDDDDDDEAEAVDDDVNDDD